MKKKTYNANENIKWVWFLLECCNELRKIGVGNTQVTCHVGVPSCGQHHRNMFIDLLLTCTITNTIINNSLASPPYTSSLPPFSFAHPPTPVLSVTLCLKPNLVEEDWWKGFICPVHHPLPHGAVDVKSTTPTHPIDYWVNTLTFYLWWCKHLQEHLHDVLVVFNVNFISPGTKIIRM